MNAIVTEGPTGESIAALNRRRFLAVSGLWLSTGLGWRPLNDDDEISRVRDLGKNAGLGPLDLGRTEHYLGIGDAPASFRKAALELCEGLAADYLKHFQGKGFDVKAPGGRLTVVLLAERAGFTAFLGEDPGEGVVGTYDLDTNRLVVFDNRAEGGPRAERANTISLFHEATHQLTFNTGLLDRAGNVPLGISEGLGTYGEVRRPDGKTKLGTLNRERLDVIVRGGRSAWAPLSSFFDDTDVDTVAPQQLYAQAWLLAYSLLQSSTRLPQFRTYLEAIRGKPSPGIEDAEQAFGPLEALDAELLRAAARLSRR